MNAEIIRAVTPLFIATIGGVIKDNDAKWSAAIGLAGTAIAGAAGLAQSTKNESNISTGQNARIIQGQDNPVQPSN